MMIPKAVIEPFEIDGFWWLPETSEYRVPGKLKFHPQHLISVRLLQPLQQFEKGVKYELGSSVNRPQVYGNTVDGSFVALHNVLDQAVTDFNFKATPVMLSELSSNGPLLVFPKMLPQQGKIWTHASVEITNQDAFFMTQAYSHGHPVEDPHLCSIRFHEPPYEIRGVDTGPFVLSVELTHSGPHHAGNVLSFSHNTEFRLAFNIPQDIPAIITEARKLMALLSVLTGDTQLIKTLTCWFEQEGATGVDRFICRLTLTPFLYQPRC